MEGQYPLKNEKLCDHLRMSRHELPAVRLAKRSNVDLYADNLQLLVNWHILEPYIMVIGSGAHLLTIKLE